MMAMQMDGKPTLGIIGAGKVGTTLARLLRRRSYRVAAVYSRTGSHAVALAEQVGARPAQTPSAVVVASDLTLVTVTDGALERLAETLSALDFTGQAIVHTSGAYDLGIWDALAARGARVGSLHPAFPFADVETAMRRLPGSAFAVEASDNVLRQWLNEVVDALDGRRIDIPAGHKALYHSALVFASNYTVTLYALARELLLSIGADGGSADAALATLLAATVENIQAQGLPAALTGPLARSDAGTIAGHIEALARQDVAMAVLYIRLAQQSLPLLAARGVDPAPLEAQLQQALTRLQE